MFLFELYFSLVSLVLKRNQKKAGKKRIKTGKESGLNVQNGSFNVCFFVPVFLFLSSEKFHSFIPFWNNFMIFHILTIFFSFLTKKISSFSSFSH